MIKILKQAQSTWQDATRSFELTTGAVVIGGCFQGLGIVRSLGRRGIPVCVIDDENSISRYSRYTTYAVRVKSLRDEQEIVQTLLTVGQRLHLNGWVLYPTREELVVALARFKDKLATQFRVPTPAWETTRWAWDKRNTYKMAEQLGIATPQTWYPRTEDELSALAEKLPVVIKPAIKEHFIYATKAKAWRADTLSELQTHFRAANALLAPGEVMLQELIPGDGCQQFSYCAFFKAGEAIGSMVVQRRRQHPPDFGRASTYVESIERPELAQMSITFLKEINYYGLVEMEYKYDLRENVYKLLDINARTWGYHTLGARAGVDFSAMLFADQLGQSVEPCQARADVKWMRLLTDLPTAMIELLHGQLDWYGYCQTLKHFDIEAVFDHHDPWPALVEIALIPYLVLKRGF